MKRYLPSTNRLLLGLLRTDSELAGVTFESNMAPNFLTRLPYVWLEVSGGSAPNEKLIGNPTVSITCWARGDLTAAEDLAEGVRCSLYDAWKNQRTNSHGSISRFVTSVFPYEERLDNQPPDVYRYFAVYDLGVRPPRQPEG